jgi:CheY-like chemotaxis protein
MAFGKLEILVVDDDEPIRRLMSEIFLEFGHEVRTAMDGFSALVEIRHRQPHILLSDLQMPGMSGFELLSVVRRRYQNIQVIAMSSAYNGTGVPNGVAADAYYTKGASIAMLIEIVDEMAKRQRQVHRQKDALMPIWVPGNGHHPTGEPFVILSCPECLRTFPQVLEDDARKKILTTWCVYCYTVMNFAVVHPTDMPPRRTVDGCGDAREAEEEPQPAVKRVM